MERNELSVCNPNPQHLSGPKLLHHLVTPPNAATAIEFLSGNEQTSLSYKELHDASDRLCDLMGALIAESGDIDKDTVIPVLIPQSHHLYISLLAILKAGGAFCPLNTDAPPERVKFILKDVSANIVLVTQELAHKIPPECDVTVIPVDTQSFGFVSKRESLFTLDSDRLAYVMYTSGSTGTPKGVGITHSAATQALLAHDRHIPEFKRFLQFAAPTFDVSVFEIFFALFRGSTLICINREEMLDDLPKAMRQMDVDACELTPTVAASLLKRREAVPRLKLLMTIGEMLKMPVVQEFGGSNTRESLLWAMYGPTEATIHCTLQTCLQSESSPGSIGVPLDTVSCFVIEPAESADDARSFNLLPKGVAGELAVGGFQLARGYINRPEQTLSVFIDSPYGRVYRTGDKAVMSPDGALECLGRLSDGQVKLRGQRIELAEIEHAALRTPGCHGASASVIDSQLVLFCSVEKAVNEDDILSSCKSWLSQYMVPSELVTMREFPRLPSGKVDTKRLKNDFLQQKMIKNVAPSVLNEPIALEKAVLDVVWQTLHRSVNLASTLTSVGLDSLSAIRLVAALRQIGYEISVASLLKCRTLADVCTSLQKPLESLFLRKDTHAPLLESRSVSELHPLLPGLSHLVENWMGCTPLQSAMLAQTEYNPEHYCNEVLFDVPFNTTPQALFEAFETVIQSNEILRTGFVHWEGQYTSVLFSQPLDGQITVHKGSHYGLKFQAPDDLLRPFRVHIIDHEEDISPGILVYAHHSIYDGWSMDMIIADVSCIVKGEVPALRPQFKEVLDFQTQVAKEPGDESRAFWTSNLLGWNKIPFPKLVGQPQPDEILSKEAFFRLSPDIVQSMALSYEISTQVIFQAALGMTWQRVVGNPDILLGSVVSTRTIPVDGIERIIGPCVAAMPLRIDTSNMDANVDVLKTIQAQNRAIMEHCNLPLAEICKLAGLTPSEAIYDVLFVYQQSLYEWEVQNSVFKHIRHIDRLDTKLLVEVEPRNDGYALQLTYHSSVISEEFVALLVEQMQEMCEIILAEPEGPLISPRHLQGLEMSIYSETTTIDNEPDDVAALFKTSLMRNPHAEAIRFVAYAADGELKESKLSYSQLSIIANQTAHYIRDSGAQVGDVIAIMMKKSTTLYTSILGIINAGCAYLPILPTTPADRVREILRQSNAKYCLVEDDAARFPRMNAVLNMNTVSLHSLPSGPPFVRPDPDRLAYVIFTSGTTGIPKGVAVSQRNLATNITHLNTVYPKSSMHSRLLQACSHAFDVSVFEIFYAWYAGMSLCAAEDDVIFGDLEHWIRELQITHLSLTPTVASLINPRNVPQVEFLVTAGEPMTMSVLEKWGSLLFQGYGPSETTNICSVKRMTKGDNIEHLGWVFPNTSVFVMVPDGLDPVPRGWVGEFCFGGSQVSRGYLNNKDLTAQKFIEHPAFGRIYRSGDLGRMLPDGSLIIIGRLDDQLKLRGQRIEAQEINSILTSETSATTAVTILVRSRSGRSDQLATFYKPCVSASSSNPLDVTRSGNQMLFATLKAKLPTYMVPSYLIPIPYVPMTSSGKVDRRHLVHWFESLSTAYLEDASPAPSQLDVADSWTDIESRIATAISESMHVSLDEIGRWTPFLTLGVDSISAIGLAKSLRRHLDSQVAISAILQNPTIAQLGSFLAGHDGNDLTELSSKMQTLLRNFEREVGNSIAHKIQDVEAILPCMPLQEAMLLQGQESYYNRILLRLHVMPGDMKLYWRQMSERHGILRTCFVTTTDPRHPIAQVVLRNWDLPWRAFEVTVPSLEGASRQHLDSLPDVLDSMIPPCSLGLIRYKGSNFLSFVCHHALYDGIAMGNLWGEIEALAHGCQLQDPVSYLPFLQQALSLPSDVESFWQEQFHGFRPLATFGRSARSSFNQSTNTASIDMSFKDVQQRIRSMGLSLLSLCQASWAAVLACVFDDPDVSFGNVVSGRTLDVHGLHKLIAPCFNTIPIRLDTSRSARNIDLAKASQELNSKLLPYQFSPLKLIQRVVGGKSRHLFHTLLLLQQPLKEMDKNIWTLEEDTGVMDIPIVCEVIPCPNLNSIVVNLHFDMNLITAELASVFTDMFKFMLRSMVLSPFGPVPSRTTIPSHLSQGLLGLVLKRERCELDSIETTSSQWSSLEIKIRKVIANISRVPEATIRRETTIFQVGLDSINAVQVASALRAQNLLVSSSDVIECSSCSKLSFRIQQNSEDSKQKDIRTDFSSFQSQVSKDVLEKLCCPAEIEAILPCTPVQNAMLVAFVQSGEADYVNSLSFKIRDTVDLDSLVAAWKLLHRRHPMLRTGFVPVSHSDSTFAMVREKSAHLSHPITLLYGRPFALSGWISECKLSMLANLHVSPWKVALVKTNSQMLMHVVIHHALYDAQSLDDLLKGLSSLLLGIPCTFPSIEPALADVLSKAKLEKSEAKIFWEAQAARVVVNKFPIMTSLREPVGRLAFNECASSMAVEEMRQAAQALGVSIQAVLQAGWARILASYLGEHSVVFGVVLAGRTSDETARNPFPCLVTVPVVTKAEDSNMGLLQSMMKYNSDLYRHQFKPLAEVQKWLGHPASPIFDTILVYQKSGGPHLNTGHWKLIEDHPSVEYSVSLEVEPREDGQLRLRLTTRSDVVPHAQAEVMLQQFDAVLIHLLQRPNETHNELYKYQKSLFSITAPSVAVMDAPVEFLHQFVERNAELQPHFPALEFVSDFNGTPTSTRTWTYKQLDDLGNRVAHLLSRVVHVGDIVAVHFLKCPEAYVSILGILKAGCSFVALDPDAPKARKEFILDDSKAVCLLTDENSSLLFALEIPVIAVDEESLGSYPASPMGHDRMFTPQTTCYCLYTSGTTGTPKGCEITHENAVQAMMAFQHLFQGHWQKDSRWLQFAALHFDVSVLEQYWSWSVGITVVAAPKDMVLDDLTGSIGKMAITHIDLTPSLARLTHPDQLPSLCKGVFITGGEQLNQEILDAWGPKAVIYNAYGPTEATIGVTMYQRVPVNGRPSNIGKQFPNVGSYVFRPGTDIPVLRGGVGELCVSGKLVGKGYLNRPQLTDERFPKLSEFNERIYRTGDLVRVLHDGCFDFLGRADDQVKLRGQRLEIGEINHVIRNNTSGVKDATTLVIRHGSKDILVAFLVGDDERMSDVSLVPDRNELGAKGRAACLDRLPGYMIPTYFIRLSHIPLSPNNKVEAKELKMLFQNLPSDELVNLTGRATATSSSTIDATVMERLTRALADFSGQSTSAISETTSIFDLGVDSISALQLSTILKSGGFPMSTPAKILRSPIVSDLARSLASRNTSTEVLDGTKNIKQFLRAFQQRYRAPVCRHLRVKTADIEYIAPCSPLQEGMISAAVAEGGPSMYFNCFDLHVNNHVPMGEVRQAWEATIRDHSILRSVFMKSTDGYLQVSLHEINDVWQSLVVGDDGDIDDVLEQAKLSWIQDNALHILSPLKFIQVNGPGRQALRLFIFHGIYDGNSFNLMNEYASSVCLSRKPPAGPSFYDVLSFGLLRNFDYCKPFWTKHLKRWQRCEIPKLPPAIAQNGDIVSSSRRLTITRLDDLRRQQNVTLQTIILSVWTIVLQTHIAKPLTIGIIIAGRSLDLPNVENTVGPLFNTIPFFNVTLNGLSWEALVQMCHQFNTDILSFQHVPLRDIQKWCSNGQPLFDNLFSFQLEKLEPNIEALPWAITDNEAISLDYSLVFEATRTSDGHLSLHLVARPDIAGRDTLQKMLDHFEQIVSTIKSSTVISQSPHGTVSFPVDAKPAPVGPNDSVPEKLGWTPVEAAIRDEFCMFVNIPAEDTSPATSILDLGIDSIDSIKISARLGKRNIELSASQIMRHQTISAIAAAALTPGSDGVPGIPVDTRKTEMYSNLRSYVQGQGVDMNNVEIVLPPTALQESMIAAMIQSDFQWYFNHDIMELDKTVNLNKLRDAWMELIDSSPILRTAFIEIDDHHLDMAYCQVVYKLATVPVAICELSNTSSMQSLIETATKTAIQGEARSNLVQVSLVSTDSQNYMVLSMAHALYDGWSLALLYDDLAKAYQSKLKPRRYSEVLMSRRPLHGYGDLKGFWETYLANASPTVFKSDHPSAGPSPGGVIRSERLSSNSLTEISEFCRKTSISLQALCTACWAAVTAHFLRSLDTVFGIVLSGRDFEGADELVFPCMNTVAVRSIIHASVSGFLRYMEANVADVRDHQGFSLRKAQAAAGLGRRELFNSLFILQKAPNIDSWGSIWRSIGGVSAVEYPVCVEAEPIQDQLRWRIACKSDIVSQLDTEGLLHNLSQVLSFFLAFPESEVLSFQGGFVSICALPQVVTEERPATDQADVKSDNSADDAFECNETALLIRQILSDASSLPTESIFPTSTLYHLGLDSISAIKVSLMLRKVQIDLKPRHLIRADSVMEIVRLAEQGHRCQREGSFDALQWKPPASVSQNGLLNPHNILEQDVEVVIPATPMQVYMLSTWQNSNASVFYPEFSHEVTGDYTHEQLVSAWDRVWRRTPILRSRFVSTGDKELPWIQVILKPDPNHSEHTSQPLWHFSVFRVGDGAPWLLRLSIHHSLYDGFSLPKLMELFYQEIHNTAERTTFHTADVAVWQNFTIEPTLTASVDSRRKFWSEYLAGCSTSPGPPIPFSSERVSYIRHQAIPNIKELQQLTSSHGTSLQALFLAAYAKTLSANVGARDIPRSVLFGIYLANRDGETDRLDPTYPTMNLVPLRVQVAPGNNLVQIAAAILKDLRLIQSDARATVGLWEIYNWTGIRIRKFVNFLSLLDDDADPDKPGLTRKMTEDRLSANGSELLGEPWLQNNAVREAYPASLDIEASVHGESLDMGVFGSADALSHEDGPRIVDNIIQHLTSSKEA
ncbi:peptide synthetase [Metarhizium album ARSEF 1941]|uniref:Nonribosomal peptide synthetase sidN n=1 Tax=Metarhizium album (strain ARSEF 1941) TaxID=1081103 RepID=A0A0B2WQF9_METAS|nr:peptide synthetase [Metarhizium album ARSEF 1941]KHN95879.1 peptide synthetase [Metarhizium album ARSEF 1941]